MPRGIYKRKKAGKRKSAKRGGIGETLTRKRGKVAPKPEFGLTYRPDDFSGTVRVWRNDWPGDVFESLSPERFKELEFWAIRFSIPLKQVVDEED